MRWIALIGLVLAGVSFADEAKTSYQSLGSHAGGVASVQFSPDGKLVASGGGDKLIRVTDAATGREVHVWNGPSSFTCVVRFSPDGQTLVAAGYESGASNAIYRYDLKTGKECSRICGPSTGGVRRLLFTPDGQTLVTAGFDGYVRLWNVAAGKEIRSFKADSGTVYGLDLSPDGKTVATAGRDGLRLWELASGRDQRREAMSRHSCVAVAFSQDGKLLASGDSTSVVLWELATGREVTTLRGFKGELSYLIFSADGRTLVTSSYDKMVRVWDVRTGKAIRETEAHSGWVWGICLSKDEKYLVSCSVDGSLKRWNVAALGRATLGVSRLSADDAEQHCKALGSRDPREALQAVWALAGDPSRSLPLLSERLTGVRSAGPTAADIERLIRRLDSDEWAERENASRALAKAGFHARTMLVRALAAGPSLEVRKRLERLVSAIDPTTLPPEDLATVRGVQALETIGTAQARDLLERLSQSPSGTPRLIEEAALAVQRLNRDQSRKRE